MTPRPPFSILLAHTTHPTRGFSSTRRMTGSTSHRHHPWIGDYPRIACNTRSYQTRLHQTRLLLRDLSSPKNWPITHKTMPRRSLCCEVILSLSTSSSRFLTFFLQLDWRLEQPSNSLRSSMRRGLGIRIDAEDYFESKHFLARISFCGWESTTTALTEVGLRNCPLVIGL